jgi:methylmalonyl-CoA/ethylmalonyl-CoA epimerase
MRLKLKLNEYRLHHIGIFTHDIVQSADVYSKLGFKLETDIVYDSLRNIYLQMLSNSNYFIELIDAKNNTSFDSLRVAKNSIGYHLCFEVEDLDFVVSNMVSGGGYKIIDPAKPAMLFNNRRVVFLLNKYSGIIELLET